MLVIISVISENILKMKQKMYWPQSRVFFFAQTAYLPEQLQDIIVDYEMLRVCFPEGFDEYITVEPVNDAQAKITAINASKMTTDLIAYAKAYYYDSLPTGGRIKPDKCSNQAVRLLEVVKKKYDMHGDSPIIDLTDIWPEQSMRNVNTTWHLSHRH